MIIEFKSVDYFIYVGGGGFSDIMLVLEITLLFGQEATKMKKLMVNWTLDKTFFSVNIETWIF